MYQLLNLFRKIKVIFKLIQDFIKDLLFAPEYPPVDEFGGNDMQQNREALAAWHLDQQAREFEILRYPRMM